MIFRSATVIGLPGGKIGLAIVYSPNNQGVISVFDVTELSREVAISLRDELTRVLDGGAMIQQPLEVLLPRPHALIKQDRSADVEEATS